MSAKEKLTDGNQCIIEALEDVMQDIAATTNIATTCDLQGVENWVEILLSREAWVTIISAKDIVDVEETTPLEIPAYDELALLIRCRALLLGEKTTGEVTAGIRKFFSEHKERCEAGVDRRALAVLQRFRWTGTEFCGEPPFDQRSSTLKDMIDIRMAALQLRSFVDEKVRAMAATPIHNVLAWRGLGVAGEFPRQPSAVLGGPSAVFGGVPSEALGGPRRSLGGFFWGGGPRLRFELIKVLSSNTRDCVMIWLIAPRNSCFFVLRCFCRPNAFSHCCTIRMMKRRK